MNNIKFSLYQSNTVSVLDLLFPDPKESASKVTFLVRQQRFFELERLNTKVDKDITKEQLNKKLDELNLWNYKM